MSALALTDCTAWVHGYDFTGDTNKLTVKAAADDLDTTVFGNTYKARIGGLRTVEASLDGYWQSATSAAVDPEAFPDLGTADRACTFSASGSTETSPAYMIQAGKFTYDIFGQVGVVTPFTLGLMSTNNVGMVRGQVAKARANVSSTGVLGSALTLTAPTATQYVYCAVHVFSIGTTITLQLQSDTAANFPSATTVATIGPLTAVGGTWMTRVAGPLVGEIAWRLNVSAITGTANIAAAIAVQ